MHVLVGKSWEGWWIKKFWFEFFPHLQNIEGVTNNNLK